MRDLAVGDFAIGFDIVGEITQSRSQNDANAGLHAGLGA